MYNFDKEIQRRNTNCIKFDATEKYFGKAGLEPLWVADMDFKTPKFVLDDIKDYLEHGIFGYPKVSDEIFDSIIKWQKKKKNILEKNNLILTNGVVASLSAAVEAYSEIGDEVIIQTPVYFPFFSVVNENNRVLLTNPLKKDEQNYYTMDLEHFKSIITPKTKILILCSPHNPVGRVWSEDELNSLAKICIENNITIISDEIHSDLVFKKFTSISSISQEIANITLTLNAPSKTFNLAGLCVSYAFSKNKDLLKKFSNIVKKREIFQVNTLGLIAMQSAYTKGEKWLDELLKYLKKNIEFTKEYLGKTSLIYFKEPEATYLLWLDFKEFKNTHKDIKSTLIENCNIALNDGISFGPEGYKFFRLNVALPKKRLKSALDMMNEYF